MRTAIRVLLRFLSVLVLAPAAFGQYVDDWHPRQDLNDKLPESIRVYELDRSDQFLWAWYISADPSDTTWQFMPVLTDGSPKPVTQFSVENNAYVAVNGGYFGESVSYSLVANAGRVLADNIASVTRDGQAFYPTRGAFGLLDDGTFDVAWIYHVGNQHYAYPDPSPNRQGTPQPRPTAKFPAGGAPWLLESGIGGGPVLVQNGEPRVTWEEEVFFGGSGVNRDTRQARTAIGHTEDGRILMVVVDGGATLPALALMMIELGAVQAVNLDGGGSSTIVVDHTLINRPGGGTVQRAVASAVLLVPRTDDGGPGEVEEAIFDTGDACCFRQVGPWFESANDPYYGDTKARIVAVGGGEARAVFELEGVLSGRYAVEALWPPANNRATNTPYIVYRNGSGDTVRVNQTQGVMSAVGPWNEIGEFDLAEGDSIVVTNDATGNTSPAYVCVDAVKLRLITPSSDDAHERPRRALLQVYPNPSTGFVRIENILPARGGELQVYDLLGRAVRSETVVPGTSVAELNLNDLPPGTYLVRVSSERSTNQAIISIIR